jgi:DNA-directed RNA polymerase specialized sigma24 family protein
MLKTVRKRSSRAHLRASDLFEEPHVSTWLFRIGVNQALTCLRSKRKGFQFRDTVDEDLSARKTQQVHGQLPNRNTEPQSYQ